MLVSEDAQHPPAGIDADIALRVDVPETEVDKRPGAAADVENFGLPRAEFRRTVARLKTGVQRPQGFPVRRPEKRQRLRSRKVARPHLGVEEPPLGNVVQHPESVDDFVRYPIVHVPVVSVTALVSRSPDHMDVAVLDDLSPRPIKLHPHICVGWDVGIVFGDEFDMDPPGNLNVLLPASIGLTWTYIRRKPNMTA